MKLHKLLVLADCAANGGDRGLAVEIIETVYRALDSAGGDSLGEGAREDSRALAAVG